MNERPLIEAESEKILSLAAETQYAPNGIVSRTLLRTANLRTVLFGFAEGQELTEHTSTQHALIQILSGECEFSLRGQVHLMKAGDFLYMPPNVPHAIKATQQFAMLLTLSKASPAPENALRRQQVSPKNVTLDIPTGSLRREAPGVRRLADAFRTRKGTRTVKKREQAPALQTLRDES
jgi:quercetin dioxygenase-like cupin family protein